MTATKGTQESNRIDFFLTKSRLPNTAPIDRLSAALEDLKHECTPTNALHPVVDLQHGTDLNKAIKRMKELFQLAITTASNLISNLSAPPITPNLVPRVASNLFPRVKTIPIHRNSTSLCQPGVNEATNRYAIGTNMRKKFDGTFYQGRITSDNGKWYKIKYNNGDKEELTHRQTTLIIEYNPISFTAGYGAALSAIINKNETVTNIALKDLSQIQDIAFSVQHPITGKEMEWKDLVSDPLTSADWILSTSNKLGRMAQGVDTNADGTQQTKGTKTIFFIPAHKVPFGQTVTYIRKVCTYCPNKAEPNRTRYTAMGNFITDYKGNKYRDSRT